jgi:hypothetical protein
VETALQTAGETVVLDRYRLARRLGSGGFGTVWLAHDLKLDRAVALKRIQVGDEAVAERARREAVAAARLSHPAIVSLHETIADDEAVYLVSELVHGSTLAQLVEDGDLSDREILRIGIALCDALLHAHGRGVVHRDVKPQNVIVCDEWLEAGAGPPAKLTDFGIARMAGDDALTRTGDVVGTLAYMAPEQAEGRGAAEPADLYALGLCLYEALSGVNPVRARGAGSTARRVGMRLPALGRLRRDLPLDLCEAIDAAVWPRVEERGTLKELRAALDAALPVAGDERGTVEGSALEPIAGVGPPARTSVPARVVAALAAAALAAAALLALAPEPAPQAGYAIAAAGLAVLLAPRLGWVAGAAGIAAWLWTQDAPTGAAVAAGVAPVPLLLRTTSAAWWSLPSAAPLLQVGVLAGAYPALAGQARRGADRAVLGLLGGWALALSEAGAVDRVGPLSLAIAGIWAAGALVLPWLVRGRNLAVDLVAGTVWTAGIAACTQAAAQGLGRPDPEGLVAGAIAAGALAVAAAASRGRA